MSNGSMPFKTLYYQPSNLLSMRSQKKPTLKNVENSPHLKLMGEMFDEQILYLEPGVDRYPLVGMSLFDISIPPFRSLEREQEKFHLTCHRQSQQILCLSAVLRYFNTGAYEWDYHLYSNVRNLKLKYSMDPEVIMDKVEIDLRIAQHHRRFSVRPNHVSRHPWETSLRLAIEAFLELSADVYYIPKIWKPNPPFCPALLAAIDLAIVHLISALNTSPSWKKLDRKDDTSPGRIASRVVLRARSLPWLLDLRPSSLPRRRSTKCVGKSQLTTAGPKPQFPDEGHGQEDCRHYQAPLKGFQHRSTPDPMGEAVP
ncbi:hypothetical protein RF11_05917 [Thelohanellus kitauei]|uniref:Uncharacterized protein n=1 Tax=Thelohanellus kitauei TaxID=669202 RepID=A0A0C2JK89_THEKT|nr:hypothetical protein RF11_05917 [Thelohanellus kitauei]